MDHVGTDTFVCPATPKASAIEHKPWSDREICEVRTCIEVRGSGLGFTIARRTKGSVATRSGDEAPTLGDAKVKTSLGARMQHKLCS